MIKKILLFVLAFVCFIPTAYTAPVITSVSNGVITGESFGSTGPDVRVWDNFESGVDSGSLDASPSIGTWVRGTDARYSSTTAHSGSMACKSVCAAYLGNTTTGVSIDNLPNELAYYASFWFWYDIPEDSYGQTKIFQMHGNPDSSNYADFAPAFHSGGSAGTAGGAWTSYHTLGSGTIDQEKWNYLISNGLPPQNSWHHYEVIAKQSSVGGAADGSVLLKCDGYTVYSKINIVTRNLSTDYWKKACLFYGMTNFTEPPVSYIDDIYVSSEYQRVEIGDNAVYANCTHREIQPAATWSDTVITGTLNIGSFSPTATVYFFVVDEDGVASAGKEVALGGTPTYNPPTITAPSDFSTTSSSVEIEGTYYVDPDLPDQSVIATWTLGEASGFCVAALGVFSCTVPVELGSNSIVFKITDSNIGEDSDTTVVTRTTQVKTSKINGSAVLKGAVIHQ